VPIYLRSSSHTYADSVPQTITYNIVVAGTVKGLVFDLKFSSDNNVNGSGFFATYQVFETAPNSSVLPSSGFGLQG